MRYPDAVLIPVAYGDLPPDVTGHDVLIVDFSYPRDVLLDMHTKAKSLRVFDHHKTAAEALAGLDFCVFDMTRSGAGITWDELYPKAPRDWLINYVEDRDLWRWALPNSREINAYLQTVARNVMALYGVSQEGPQTAYDRGRVALRVREDYVDSTAKGAYSAYLDGETEPCLAVNAGGWEVSDLLGELAKRSPSGYAFAFAERAEGGYYYSLRARKEGVDVSAIAKRFGGGGHFAAAAFRSHTRVHHRVLPGG